MNLELRLSLLSLAVAMGGVAFKRGGRAAILCFVLFFGSLSIPRQDVSNGPGLVFVLAFPVLMIVHGRKYGKKTPIWTYNPFNAECRIPRGLRLFLLGIGAICALVNVWATVRQARDGL